MSKKYPNLFFLEIPSSDKEIVLKKFPGSNIFSGKMSEVDIIKKCKEVEVLCVFAGSKISGKVIKGLKKLKIIVTRGVGYNHIDLRVAKDKDIIVCNVPDYGSHIIAEFVFALMLSGLRNVREGDERVEKSMKFSFSGLKGVSLRGKTLGIIGTGRIGLNVARIASLGFLMNVIAVDPSPNNKEAKKMNFKYVKMNDLLKKSDIISLHCPLLESNKHLINKKSISKMKDGVIIVNTSRGGLINTKDLTLAIKRGKIYNAFLDVLEHEENIKKHKELINIPGVITTPHIAFYADDSMNKIYSSAFKSIDEYLKGKTPGNIVLGV
jgi:D-lactate dehydrogenase